MKSIAEQIKDIFPAMSREEYVAWIKDIQEQLCPTCLENADFNPGVVCDCLKRPKYVSAEDIYEGECNQEVADHWVGALKDARGALKQIAESHNRALGEEPYAGFWGKSFRDIFTQACKDAQSLMGEGKTWRDLDPLSDDRHLCIGMAYKFADKDDTTYSEMARLGEED
jgi:hypothetical protein